MAKIAQKNEKTTDSGRINFTSDANSLYPCNSCSLFNFPSIDHNFFVIDDDDALGVRSNTSSVQVINAVLLMLRR